MTANGTVGAPLVTVSIAYYQIPPGAFRRAVEAVLSQTFTDFRLVIINDADTTWSPWPVISDFTDPRIVRFDMKDNRGRYFADAVALTACDTEWFAPHDADDEASPEWLERMLDAARPDDVAVLAAQRVYARLSDDIITEVPKPLGSGGLDFRAHLAGLWRTSWARKVNLMHPEYRVAWDTFATSLPHIVGPYSVVEDPLYMRHRRLGSLSNSPRTGRRSTIRRNAVRSMERLWTTVTSIDRPTPTKVGRAIGVTITPKTRGQVKALAAVLSNRITTLGATDALVTLTQQSGTQDAPMPLPRQAADLTVREALWGDWALTRPAAAELDARLAALQPRVVVEAGSGASTLILARYARATGARVLSLEHVPRFADATKQLLSSEGMAGVVEVVTAPLARTADGPWYGARLPDGIGFALIDGPPMRDGGRAAAWPNLAAHMADRWELWLDDTDRQGEQDALDRWTSDPTFAAATRRSLTLAGRGLTAITSGYRSDPQDGSDVVVTVLATARPDHLDRTLSSFADAVDMKTLEVIALNNGNNPDVGNVFENHGITPMITDTVLPIGEATSRLALAAAESSRGYWLHLEDDWSVTTLDPHWLTFAVEILALESRVRQVRMRHIAERTLPRHMVTGYPLNWQLLSAGFLMSNDAHWTFNPALVRVEDIETVFPCVTEKDAQRRYTPCPVAQLMPGAFVHLGEDVSMRTTTGNVW